MPSPRIRNRTMFGDSGTFSSPYGNRNEAAVVNAGEIQDTSGYVFHYPLSVSTIETNGCKINGNDGTTVYDNYPMDEFRMLGAGGDIFDANAPSEAELVAKLLRKTNPSGADSSVPTMIGELRELPQLLRESGLDLISSLSWKRDKFRFFDTSRGLPRALAKRYLYAKFGVAPLINDVISMVTFQNTVQTRFNLLKNIRDNGGHTTLRRSLAKNKSRTERYEITHSSTAHVFYPRVTEELRHWYSGYVVWRLNNPGSLPQDDEQLRILARNAALGLNSDALIDSLWNLLPWTWLIDWFSNVGDLVSLTQNSLDMTPGPIRLMRTSTKARTFSECDADFGINPNFKLSSGSSLRIVKVRSIPSYDNPLSFKVPVLTGGQLGILASLSVLKV